MYILQYIFHSKVLWLLIKNIYVVFLFLLTFIYILFTLIYVMYVLLTVYFTIIIFFTFLTDKIDKYISYQ